MQSSLQPGTTLFIPSGAVGYHLFVIVDGPKILPYYGSAEQFLLVPICSAVPGATHECVIDAGCHPFVQHESYADFSHAVIKAVRILANILAAHYTKSIRPQWELKCSKKLSKRFLLQDTYVST